MGIGNKSKLLGKCNLRIFKKKKMNKWPLIVYDDPDDRFLLVANGNFVMISMIFTCYEGLQLKILSLLNEKN